MPEQPDPPRRAPGSMARRRLLVAGGLGGLSYALLRRAPDPAHTTRASAGAGPASDRPAQAREPVAPPALDDADPAPGADHTFDLVIAGGRVIDPDTGFDAVADVGVDGDTIRAISPGSRLAGREVVDAAGLVVAPGFIDVLSYEPNSYGVWYKLADGVTTNLGMHGINSTADDFFAAFEGQVPVHYGGAYDNPHMRGTFASLGGGQEALPYQIDQLADLLRAGFDSGWLGLDLEPEYTPGVGTAEIHALASVAAEYERPVFFHARYSEPDRNLEGVDEVLQVARETGAAVHVAHITSTGGTFTMEQTLERIETARSEGLDVTACLYPYDFWATYIHSTRLGPDPVTGRSVVDRYGIRWEDLVIPGTGESLTEESYHALRADTSANPLVAALDSIPEEEIALALQTDWVMIGSDAIPEESGNNHPRASGAFARTLGRYARERGVLSLRDALAKMTILPARRVEARCPDLQRKGRLQRGAHADITIFDPDTVIDTSTVEEPARYSTGISYVLVMGQVALDPDGPRTDVLAGRPLRAA